MLPPVAIAALVHAWSPTLEWHAPPQCPDDGAFAARVGALLGDATTTDAQAVVTVVAEPDGGFAAEVRCVTAGTATIRQVRGPVCESVADAAALVVAVQIDALSVDATARAQAGRRTPVPEPTVSARAARRTATPVVPPPPTPAVPPRARRIRGALRLGGGASFRQVPAVAPAIEIGAALLVGRARVQLDATWVLERSVRLPPPQDDAGATVTLVGAALRGGFAPGVGAFEFPATGGIEVGDMTARGVGVRGSRLRHGAWVAALVGVGVAWVPVRAFALRLDPALALGLARPRFGVDAPDGARTLYQPPVVGVRLGASLEVRFW